jgi:hypothetical protein
MSVSTDLERREGRALERSEIERRRVLVARYRFIEAQMTAAEIVEMLRKENPPIVVTIRTVERDVATIRADVRRYVNARNFDAAFEIGAALHRYELIARAATRHALTANAEHGSRWARVGIRATEAKTRLLQDINLVNRTIGTLFIDDRAERIPSGEELARELAAVNVTEAENTSVAELHYKYGDEALALAAAREAEK